MSIDSLLSVAITEEKHTAIDRLLKLGANPNFDDAKALFSAVILGSANVIEKVANEKITEENFRKAYDVSINLGLYDEAGSLLKSALRHKHSNFVSEMMNHPESIIGKDLLGELFMIAVETGQFRFAVCLSIYDGVDINLNNGALVKSVVAANDFKILVFIEINGANMELYFLELLELARTQEMEHHLIMFRDLCM